MTSHPLSPTLTRVFPPDTPDSLCFLPLTLDSTAIIESFYFYFQSAPSLCPCLPWTLGKCGFQQLTPISFPWSHSSFTRFLGLPLPRAGSPDLVFLGGEMLFSHCLSGDASEGSGRDSGLRWPPLSPRGHLQALQVGRRKTFWCPANTGQISLCSTSYPHPY